MTVWYCPIHDKLFVFEKGFVRAQTLIPVLCNHVCFEHKNFEFIGEFD